MLPLTLSYILAATGERKDKSSLLPTLSFSAGLASVFCGAGLAVSYLGKNILQGSEVGPFFSGVISVTMGLQLFEIINLPLLSFDGPSIEDGGEDDNGLAVFLRTYLLGVSSALVASPCATPVLTALLATISTSDTGVSGGLLLLGYTLGFLTPLVVVSATGSQALMKAQSMSGEGSWAGAVGKWVTPLSGGFLVYYGTGVVLESVWGDPSLMALAPVMQ